MYRDGDMHKVRRTTINLNLDLVAEAQRVLGEKTATGAIHKALRNEVRRAELAGIADWDLSDLSLEKIKEMRAPRTDADFG
jgi:Arc/MetJ family transcription regulator